MRNELTPPDAPAIALLPCPFCGHPARMDEGETPNFVEPKKPGRPHFYIQCSSPNSVRCPSKHWLCESPEEAAKFWNSRQSP